MKTSFPAQATPQWFIVDATDLVLGRLSTKIANVLRGRNTPSYVPHMMSGNHVIIINAEKVKVSGSKLEQKKYFRHTGWLGHLRTTTMKEQMGKDPTKILFHAVKGMIPKNASRQHILKKLHIYAGPAHEHDAQKPVPFPL